MHLDMLRRMERQRFKDVPVYRKSIAEGGVTAVVTADGPASAAGPPYPGGGLSAACARFASSAS